ncbi:MAG TPA: ABC transporter ATP-binding protein [Actinophytocola sp.]|uniref:ABC transporter ATP-binding protein n=1 Tax=Actinophytocola sp. TaxID=1872138 RepID=UPI002DDC9BB7|nr:ABC transporter ATP-binding protein [Actinophytocola sp.]HEV2780242.1 ABC transporter ATP-binding protein [Actinophytocola sp.]
MSLLEFRDVSVSYAGARTGVPAVRGVSLRLDSGEKLGLAGESGCGKSTLAMSVLRLLPRSATVSGQILLDGEDVGAMSWGRLRAVRWASTSVVFQGAMHALNPVRKVGEQIAEPLVIHHSGPQSAPALRARVNELLGQVELPAAKADAYPHELSGGQKQRVMIAMALACRPRLIIADEPTTALDVIVQAQVLEVLTRLVTEHHLGLIMISHDLAVLAATCDRLAIMYRGEIVEEGDSRTLIRDPQHPHTKALAAAFPTVGDPIYRYAPATLTSPTPQQPAPTPIWGGGRVRGQFTADPRQQDPDPAGHPQVAEVSTAPLLRVDNLRVTFHGRHREITHAVAGVSLDVHEGEIVALVGQSGSGKTTLARTILGLQKPTAGQVIFAGEPIPTTSRGLRAYRRQVQLVLQDPTSALNPRHTVYEAVAEGLRIHRLAGDEHERVAEALRNAELRPPEEFMPVLPQELSGGQRQRVVIAGALALEPRLLVADEPVASLDASVRGEILALLLRLRARLDLAALVITHDLGLAWNIADRVAVMYRGALVEVGPVDDVLANPRHGYTRSLLAALPDSGTVNVQ